MITVMEILPGITLRCCQESRFKQGCMSIQFLRLMDRQEAALNALLPAVLLRGTVRCPDLRAITQRLDDLYGASASTLVRRVGDYQTVGLYAGFISDKYALTGDRVLEPMLAFVGELLLEPATEGGVFRRDYVESEKKNLISTIEAERNDKRVYAMGQLLKHMCRGDSFGLPRLGTPEQVASITPGELYDHYQKILRSSPIELFYVGSRTASEIAQLLRPIFAALPRDVMPLPPQQAFAGAGGGCHTQTLDVAQGKLCMGYTTPITNRCPEFPAMQLLNTLFGAGMTSKLFMNIREKMSLCYSIGSGYYGTKGIVTVSAGIDFDK